MHRRTLLATAAAGLAAPRLGRAAEASVIRFVPQANLTSLDPVWTTAVVSRNHGYLVYDTLYGLDEKLTPRPQMAEGHVIEDDGRRWTVTLRPGLKFHDGEPVRSIDCAASMKRWMARDGLGQTLAERLDAMETPDDRRLVFRLKKPFPPLALALGKAQQSQPVIMPQRIAETDPFQQVRDATGSGPFRFLPGEFVPGSFAAYEKFAGYVPRNEPVDMFAGGKQVHVDRVEWKIIPEAATALAGLRTGEVDWIEMPLPDLLPSVARVRDVQVGQLEIWGLYPVLRFNHIQGPTKAQGVRRAIMAAIDTREVMTAIMGPDQSGWKAPVGTFAAGTPYASNAGMEFMGPRPKEEIARLLEEAHYDGAKVVLLHPTDQTFYHGMTEVCAAAIRKTGINLDDQSMDWGTVVQRRGKKEPLDQGGWSLFATSFPALDYLDPITAPALRGNGTAWYGWPVHEGIEKMREDWIAATDENERKRLAAGIQKAALEAALYVPLGQYTPAAAWRKSLSGLLRGPGPMFWNVRKG